MKQDSSVIILKMKDIDVLKIDLDTGICYIYNNMYLPWQLKDNVTSQEDMEMFIQSSDLSTLSRIYFKNKNSFIEYLARRVLPLSRSNAKWILNAIRVSQSQDPFTKAKLALSCNSLSLQDNYWTVSEGTSCKWIDMDLRTNHLNNALTDIALHGKSITVTGQPRSPEFTGQGAFAKAWVRESDGLLWLYKKSTKGSYESEIEVMVSNILDNCNVEHIKYYSGVSNNEHICKCQCMTTDKLSILPAEDYIYYCERTDKNWLEECLTIDSVNIYKTWIVDYLISNKDRHGMNWGFFYDCDNMQILKCHPLFDHNSAFTDSVMDNKNMDYLFDEIDGCMSIRDCALKAMENVEFYFYRKFTRDDFLTERQFESFMDRANDLKIKVINDNDGYGCVK